MGWFTGIAAAAQDLPDCLSGRLGPDWLWLSQACNPGAYAELLLDGHVQAVAVGGGNTVLLAHCKAYDASLSCQL